MNTDKLLAVLNHINCEEYENHEWGVCGNMDETHLSSVFPVDSNQNCPNNFIWLWLNVDEQYEWFKVMLDRNKLLEPDLKLDTDDGGHSVILIWNLD